MPGQGTAKERVSEGHCELVQVRGKRAEVFGK